ncbi:MAG: hypothetical protein ACI9BW_002716 [Gammaproteobacteria bacterium]|jgi:hypothetical protein
MNWGAAGAIGEIIGAAAVVISVIYLAVQVKKQTQEAKLAATRDLAAAGQDVLDRITSDFEFTAVYGRAVQNYNDLPDEQRLWAAIIFQRIFRLMEQQTLHISHGNTDPQFFESFRKSYLEALTFPGVQQWWANSKNIFSDEFVMYVDEQSAVAKSRGYNSTFKKSDDA